MRAKFSAQILTGAMWVDSTSAPAAVSNPTRVSMSGRPAATRLPKASTSTAIVTGQDSTSERIIASWLTLLKSDHSPLDPVSSTEMFPSESVVSGPVRSSAARTISLESPLAPAWMIAVRPSGEMLTPGCGGTTVLTRGSASSSSVALAIARRAAGSSAIGPALSCTTTCRAVEPSPAKSLAMTSLARTEELVSSCQPAPDRAEVTCGANAPKAARTASQTSSTMPRWPAAQAPRRGIQRWPACPPTCCRGGWAVVDVIALLGSARSHGYPLGYRSQSDNTPWGIMGRTGRCCAVVQLPAEEMDRVVRRLRRAQGQIGGILRMIEEGRDCEVIVTQVAAVSRALDRAGFAIIATGLKQCLLDNEGVDNMDTERLEKLFLSLA